jgi:RNA polymerase sigma-70 factor (ECF subfamily)
MDISPAGTVQDELVALPHSRWVEPIPDAHALPSDVDPAHLAVLRQSIRLAFVAALQHLPPKQRAALLLTEVLGWSVAEVADSLGTSTASINSALQRARATLATRDLSQAPAPLSTEQHVLLDRYVDAFERYDVETLTCLLRDDATLSMPPYSLWLQGSTSISGWLLGRGIGCRGSRLLKVDACGSPAFAQYRQPSHGVFKPWALVVLELDGNRVAAQSFFLDTERLFPLFNLPLELLG